MRSDNDHDGASSITSFRSLSIAVAVSHCFFYLKVMDDWQTQNKSVGCIPHSKLMTNYDLRQFKLGISKSAFKN